MLPEEETKKHGPNGRTEQNSRKKELSKMEKNNLSDAVFKTLGYKDTEAT